MPAFNEGSFRTMSNFSRGDTVRELERLVDAASRSRLQRFAQNPFRNCVIQSLRLAHSKVHHTSPLIWNDRFVGLIPEGVSSLVWRYGAYEFSTSLLVSKLLRDGDAFIDLGAHFGYFSILASRLVGASGRVVSVEPMPETFEFLKRNIAANSLSNVTAVNVAVGSHAERVTFNDYGPVLSSLNGRGEPRGTLSGKERSHREVSVDCILGDTLLQTVDIGGVRLIKLDVESAEEEALRGLRETLAGKMPVVLVELGGITAGEDARARRIIDLMDGWDYRPYTFDGNSLRALRWTSPLPYMNAVFVSRDSLVATNTLLQ